MKREDALCLIQSSRFAGIMKKNKKINIINKSIRRKSRLHRIQLSGTAVKSNPSDSKKKFVSCSMCNKIRSLSSSYSIFQIKKI